MALAPEKNDEDSGATPAGAARRVARVAPGDSRDLEIARLSQEIARLCEQLRVERADHEHLLAVVSHELRTPITVVGGYLRLLLAEDAGPLAEEQRRFLAQAQRACEKLGSFVKRLLEAARAPLCVGALELRSSSLGPVFSEVADAYREALTARGLVLEQDIEAAHRARFDRDAIERVLANLVDNAIRFADRRISVSTRRTSMGGREFVEVAVTDDGPGVRPADRVRIFAPYVQGRDGGADGLGLGLALCMRLVEAHAGQISLVPNPEGGSRFAFTLPSEE